jgi:prepilin peptidase CpaA
MNLAEHAPLWLAALVGAALLAAAIEDIVRLRISNVTSIAVLLGAIAAIAIQGFSPSLWQNGVVFVAVPATGLWMSLDGAIWLIASVFLAGGIVALAYILLRLIRGGGLQLKGGNRIPYGVAIAVGGLYVLGVQFLDSRQAHSFTPLPPVKALQARH